MAMPGTAVRTSAPRLSCILEPRWSLGFLGLLLYVFVEYTSLPDMYPILGPLHTGKIVVGIALLGYLVAPRSRAALAKDAGVIDAVMLLMMFSVFLSALFNAGRQGIWSGFSDVLKWIVIYFLVSRILTSRWRLRGFLFLLLLLNLKLAQFAVRSYISGRDAGFSGMEIIKLGGASGGTTAFFGNAADFGLAMCVVWGLAWALFFRKGNKLFWQLFLATCFVGYLLAILVCGSRGAVLGAAAIVLAALIRTPKKAGAIVLLMLFGASLWFVLPGASKTRFQHALNWRQDKDAYSRIMLWKAGLYMWADHPMFGVGPYEFGHVFVANPLYVSWSPYGTAAHATHSLYIEAIAELGSAGTLLLLAAVLMFFRLNAKTRAWALAHDPDGRRSWDYCLAAGLDLAMLGYLVSGAFLAVLYYPHLWILLGLGVATNRVCCVAQPSEQPASPWRGLQAKRPLTAPL
jgi:putative inorganic carbon (HCO3(-)) transporter